MDGDAAKRALRDELGKDYSTNREITEKAFEFLLPKWPAAAKNAEQARQHHESGGTPSPANPSTEVDRLVRALNDSAPPHLRKIPCREA